jgi:hypothetical protein
VQALSREQLKQLDSGQLASRIDLFFEEDHVSRDGSRIKRGNVTTAGQILSTSALQNMPEEKRKPALMFFYRSQFQSTLCERFLGIENDSVHVPDRTETKWQNPKIQILSSSTRQAQIVASRVAFECLMEFVFFVGNQSNLKEKQSKLKGKSKRGAFKKWCIAHKDKFGWLVFYLLVVDRYDREHRTAEVHGTSLIANEALRCDVWSPVDGELDLTNLMLNIWPSILQALNNVEVTGYSCGSQDAAIFKEFSNWKSVDLEKLWATHSQIGDQNSGEPSKKSPGVPE